MDERPSSFCRGAQVAGAAVGTAGETVAEGVQRSRFEPPTLSELGNPVWLGIRNGAG